MDYSKMCSVYIGLGSNKGKRIGNIKEALNHLKEKMEVEKVSSFYLTEPVGIKGGWFVNCVLKVRTDNNPKKLLEILLEIEKRMGRIRTKKKISRVIDLDLLFYEGKIIKEKDLTLPHPRLHKRRFVLIPLAEINPELYHPILKKSIKEILESLIDAHRVYLVKGE